jgi:hypothetical protein
MAHLSSQHSFSKNQPSFLESVGQKVKTISQIAVGVKQIYDITKALAPVAAAALVL